MAESSHKPTRTQILASVGCIIIFGMNVSYQVVMTSFPYIMEFMGITTMEASLMPTVVSVGTAVMSLIGTRLIDKLTPRWSMLVGTVCVTLFLALNAVGLSYVPWVASGLLAGVGSALGATGAIAAIMRQYWGMASGSKFAIVTGVQTLLVSGYTALMAFLWSVMDFQSAFWVIAAITLVLGGGANLICFRKPDSFVVEELAMAKQAAADKAAAEAESAKVGWGFFESFKHSPIYLFTIGFLAIAVINGGLTTFLTTFLTDAGVDRGVAALFQSYLTIVGGLHILYSGFLQQRFGNRIFFVFFYGCCTIGFILLATWAGISGGQMLAFLAIGLLLAGCMKPILSTTGIVATDLFGNKDYTAYNAYSQAITNVGRMISSVSTAGIMTALGSVALCWVFAGLGVVAAAGFVAADVASPFAKKANEKRKAALEKKKNGQSNREAA